MWLLNSAAFGNYLRIWELCSCPLQLPACLSQRLSTSKTRPKGHNPSVGGWSRPCGWWLSLPSKVQRDRREGVKIVPLSVVPSENVHTVSKNPCFSATSLGTKPDLHIRYLYWKSPLPRNSPLNKPSHNLKRQQNRNTALFSAVSVGVEWWGVWLNKACLGVLEKNEPEREEWAGSIFPTMVNTLTLLLIILLKRCKTALEDLRNRAENVTDYKDSWIRTTVYPDCNFDRLGLT